MFYNLAAEALQAAAASYYRVNRHIAERLSFGKDNYFNPDEKSARGSRKYCQRAHQPRQ